MALTLAVPDAASAWSSRSLGVARVAAIVAVLGIPVSTALVSTACGVLLIALAVSGRLHRVAAEALRQPLGLAIVVFLAVAALGMLWSAAPWPERWASLWGWRKPVYAFLLLGLFQDDPWKRRFVRALIAAAALGAVASFLARAGWIPSRPNHEPGVLFQNHTTQGMYFAVGIACCLQAWFTEDRRLRWGLASVVVLLLANILFVTPGRSPWLVLAAIPFVFGAMRFGLARAPLALVAAGLLCALAYAVSPMVRERAALALHEATTHAQATQLTSVGFRAMVYSNTAELIAQRPLFGYGTGSFRGVFTEHVRARYQDWRGEGTSDPHNQFLLVAMETGALGLAAFLGLLVAGFLNARRAGPHGVIGAIVLGGWILSSLFNSHFRTFPEGHLLALVLGATLAMRPARERVAGRQP